MAELLAPLGGRDYIKLGEGDGRAKLNTAQPVTCQKQLFFEKYEYIFFI